MILFYLVALVASALVWIRLRTLPVLRRTLLALGVFFALCGVATLLIVAIGDESGPNARELTPEDLREAARTSS